MSNGQIQIPFPFIKLPPSHIKALVQKIRSNINLTTHKKKFTKYENSFVGNELVSYLLKSKAVTSRRDAIEICHRLFEARLIVHVKNNELFKDDKELYHLIDPVAGSDLVPVDIDVKRARDLIRRKRLPKNESAYKSMIKSLQAKGLRLPEISRAICLEKYLISNVERFPQTLINKKRPKLKYNAKKSKTQQIKFAVENNPQYSKRLPSFVNKAQLIDLCKTIIGILRYAFLAADRSRSNDLDLSEFEYLLDRLGIRVSHKGAELLFRAILSQHNKRFLGFYEFKMAFMVTDPMRFIQQRSDVHPARVLRRHIRQYYETVAEAHKANRKKLAELAWGLFSNDKKRNATMYLSEFREGINYLGLRTLSDAEVAFIFHEMNHSQTGILKKEEFAKTVKKEIPVSLGKVVNVKEILLDAFENLLREYSGTKTQFPKRQRTQSIVNRESQYESISIATFTQDSKPVSALKKGSIFQRLRYKSKAIRRKTVKAPVTSPFGSNLAEMAQSGNHMMDDVILSMVTEDDTVRNEEDYSITAQDFKQLFAHSFYPNKESDSKHTNKKPINISQFSMLRDGPHGIIPPPNMTSVTPPPPPIHSDRAENKNTIANMMQSLPNPPTLAQRESSYYSSDNSSNCELYGEVYGSDIEQEIAQPPPPPPLFKNKPVSPELQASSAITKSNTLNTLNFDPLPKYTLRKSPIRKVQSATALPGLPPPPPRTSPKAKQEDTLDTLGLIKRKSRLSTMVSEYSCQEEEKQSTRNRNDDEESLLDLDNNRDLQKAIQLQKEMKMMNRKHFIISTTHTEDGDEGGKYSPPPPTHLSVDVGTSPPFWSAEEEEEDPADVDCQPPDAHSMMQQEIVIPKAPQAVEAVANVDSKQHKKTLTDCTEIQNTVFPAPDTQYIVQRNNGTYRSVDKAQDNEAKQVREAKQDEVETFPAPNTQYVVAGNEINVDERDEERKRNDTDTWTESKQTESTFVVQNTVNTTTTDSNQPQEDAFPPPDTQYATETDRQQEQRKSRSQSAKVPALILPDDILNESDDELPQIPMLRQETLSAVMRDKHASAGSASLSMNSNSKQNTLLPIVVIKTPKRKGTAASDCLTYVSHPSPSVTYETPLEVMAELNKQREAKKLENSEENGLSFHEANSLPNAMQYNEGRDSEFVKFIGGLHEDADRARSDTDDSLRQLQVQYQRESQLKDDLQFALFHNTNIGDHEDPHPKDVRNRRNMRTLKESEELDKKKVMDYKAADARYAARSAIDKSHSVESKEDPARDNLETSAAAVDVSHDPKSKSGSLSPDSDPLFEKMLKPSVAKRISRGNSPESCVQKDTKYDLLYKSVSASTKNVHDDDDDEKEKVQKPFDLNMLPGKSIPYSTPTEFGVLDVTKKAPMLETNKSHAIIESGDEDPGAAGTANDIIRSSEEDSADTYWPWNEGSSSSDKKSGSNKNDDDDDWKATPPMMMVPIVAANKSRDSENDDVDETRHAHISTLSQPPHLSTNDFQRLSDIMKPDILQLDLDSKHNDDETKNQTSYIKPQKHVIAFPDFKPKQKAKEKVKKVDKYTAFKKLPPIPGVITVKSVKCTDLARGKMRSSETYYLRVYQGKCERIESSQRGGRSPRKISHAIKMIKKYEDISHAKKIAEIKSRKLTLPVTKKLGSLPSLCVIKSYPVFAKHAHESVTWKNLPASITKDAKQLTVGVYMKRDRDLVLIGSTKLAKTKKNVIPKPRIGRKNTSLKLTLDVPNKFGIWCAKSVMEITYSFCPRQFNVDVRVLQCTKLPIYTSKIPVVLQLIRLHLLKITQDALLDGAIEDDSDEDYDSDSDAEEEYKKEYHNDRFYNCTIPTKNLINNMVGDMNSGHYKLDKTEAEVVWHGLMRWFREIKPYSLLDAHHLATEFIDDHSNLSDSSFMSQLMQLTIEPYLSIFLWSIDLLIELSEWYQEKLTISNKMIDYFVPNYFGFDPAQKTKLFLVTPNAYSFVLRILQLRKKR